MKIVVTGANRGLGFELTKIFAEKGHQVAACYYPAAQTEELQSLAAKYGSNIKMIPMDVTKEKDVEEAAGTVKNEFKQIDAVISNAGVLCDGDRVNDILSMNVEDLRTSIEVNLVGPALVIKHFYPLMKKSTDSLFITITSEGGSITNVGSNFPAYSISKTAANKLVAIFKKTVSDVRVFAMHPGRMNTVMGRTTAQIEPSESAEGIYRLITGGHREIGDDIWFIDYKGLPMEI